MCGAKEYMAFEPFWSEIGFVLHYGLELYILVRWNYYMKSYSISKMLKYNTYILIATENFNWNETEKNWR